MFLSFVLELEHADIAEPPRAQDCHHGGIATPRVDQFGYSYHALERRPSADCGQ